MFSYREKISFHVSKYCKNLMKTKHAINIKPQIHRKAERLSIQEDKDTADHISRNVAYGQFARRFSYTAERRVPIRGAFLGAGR